MSLRDHLECGWRRLLWESHLNPWQTPYFFLQATLLREEIAKGDAFLDNLHEQLLAGRYRPQAAGRSEDSEGSTTCLTVADSTWLGAILSMAPSLPASPGDYGLRQVVADSWVASPFSQLPYSLARTEHLRGRAELLRQARSEHRWWLQIEVSPAFDPRRLLGQLLELGLERRLARSAGLLLRCLPVPGGLAGAVLRQLFLRPLLPSLGSLAARFLYLDLDKFHFFCNTQYQTLNVLEKAHALLRARGLQLNWRNTWQTEVRQAGGGLWRRVHRAALRQRAASLLLPLSPRSGLAEGWLSRNFGRQDLLYLRPPMTSLLSYPAARSAAHRALQNARPGERRELQVWMHLHGLNAKLPAPAQPGSCHFRWLSKSARTEPDLLAGWARLCWETRLNPWLTPDPDIFQPCLRRHELAQLPPIADREPFEDVSTRDDFRIRPRICLSLADHCLYHACLAACHASLYELFAETDEVYDLCLRLAPQRDDPNWLRLPLSATGYEQGWWAHHQVRHRELRRRLRESRWWLSADISNSFYSVDLKVLWGDLRRLGAPEIMRSLLRHTQSGPGQGWMPFGRISPILLKLYLHPVVRHLASRGYRFVLTERDEFHFFCDSEQEAERATEDLQNALGARGLRLNPGKLRLRPSLSPYPAPTQLGKDISWDSLAYLAARAGVVCSRLQEHLLEVFVRGRFCFQPNYRKILHNPSAQNAIRACFIDPRLGRGDVRRLQAYVSVERWE